MDKNRVFFYKPNLDLFHSMGLTSVDMHFHSRYSDSYTRVQTIVKKAAKKHMGVAVTDHNAIEGSMKASRNAKGVMVVPGIEVSCMEGPHILLYFYSPGELKEFYEKEVEPFKQGNPYMAVDMKVPELIEASRDYNCIRGAAHPYGTAIINNGLSKSVKKHYVQESVFDHIDTMEVICGAMNRRLNRKAHDRALEIEKGFTGGTDGHTIFELGNVVTSSYADDLDSFLTSILKKRNYVVGKETRLVPKLLPGTNMVTKHMKYAMPSIKLQYNINKVRVKRMPAKIISGTRKIGSRLKNIGSPKKL